MAYPSPPISKNAVRRAGKSYQKGVYTDIDVNLIDSWRASHGYVINTFQIWLRRKIQKQEFPVEFAQRLKRRNTVLDKLTRVSPNGTPLIRDVTSMHDFAGCRLIFESIEDLVKFREELHSSDSMRNVEHRLRHDLEKYDYIAHPKPTGYRGVHDVFKHIPRSHRRSDEVRPWDGLMVEIQYRTRAQHAWATAVEISDLLDDERTKFDLFESKRSRFFTLASELIARTHENRSHALTELTTPELREELQDLEGDLGIMQRLKLLRQFEEEDKLQTHNVLNIYRDNQDDLRLDVLPFPSAAKAIAHASELESDINSLNAVYVRAGNPKQLRSAYRNYFNDPVDFVELLTEATED
jgi:putative GTP pyrophosphokinase